MRPLRCLALVVAFALVVAGCAPLNVSSHIQKGVDLSGEPIDWTVHPGVTTDRWQPIAGSL